MTSYVVIFGYIHHPATGYVICTDDNADAVMKAKAIGGDSFQLIATKPATFFEKQVIDSSKEMLFDRLVEASKFKELVSAQSKKSRKEMWDSRRRGKVKTSRQKRAWEGQ